MSFTPGPWKLVFFAENVAVLGDRAKPRDCEHIALIHRGVEQSNTTEREIADANARLIAAAPDGLAFAERYVQRLRRTWVDGPPITHPEHDLFAEAVAFIAKAGGQ